ncbi:acyl-CoA dehydrogenase [Pseudomonas sp. HR96]|uniref:acyl-CoA dehydrogenase n=1 Tax=Pseudomonas sp. HR96 TaxID=1027966 RepID=UPI002A75E919|nr:acyl-CoA dehydrogenase [Pseudomonas sp. HR96]WPO97992.1 acyl-CoA dehydrogenase [Pseudomonas sp. HR96]
MSTALAQALSGPFAGYPDSQALGQRLRQLQQAGLDRLPVPGSGQTLARFQALAEVAGHDLGLCKLYEGHTDALAIMEELGHPQLDATSLWGIWASEPPSARLEVRNDGGRVVLAGRKAWCSGARVVDNGLVTAWDAEGRQQLVAVQLQQPSVQVVDEGWHAVGMAATQSLTVVFDQTPADAIGGPGDYLSRPGFWQGGIGIAACWFGAARALGEALLQHCGTRGEPQALAHLGAVDAALHGAASTLRQAAEQLDRLPTADCQLLARRARAVIEHSCEQVLHHTGRALGAGPYCHDLHFARLMADLPVYLRQSHAERDLAALGQMLHTPQSRTWPL